MKKYIIIAVLVLIIAAGFFIFLNQSKPKNNNSAPVATTVLDQSRYQEIVSPILESLSQGSDLTADSLAAAITNLSTLSVNKEIKDDHLLLFSGLDATRMYLQGTAGINVDLIKQRLNLFAQHQSWAKNSLDKVVAHIVTS